MCGTQVRKHLIEGSSPCGSGYFGVAREIQYLAPRHRLRPQRDRTAPVLPPLLHNGLAIGSERGRAPPTRPFAPHKLYGRRLASQDDGAVWSVGHWRAVKGCRERAALARVRAVPSCANFWTDIVHEPLAGQHGGSHGTNSIQGMTLPCPDTSPQAHLIRAGSRTIRGAHRPRASWIEDGAGRALRNVLYRCPRAAHPAAVLRCLQPACRRAWCSW